MGEVQESSVDGTENEVQESSVEGAENEGEITEDDKKIFAEIKQQNEEMKLELEKVRQSNLQMLEKLNIQTPQKSCEELMNEMF